ncbi:MAG: hypothetical protein ACO26U_11650 [Burkholderiaceae bacterium]
MPFFGFDRVMSCTRADLARWLTEFSGSDHGMATSGEARISQPWGILTVTTEEMPERRIGLARFKALQVRFIAPEGEEAQAREWITRFDRHTQRGGG